ncbi:hypothetical protein SERLA73DRAFT_128546, partial [Serpula lacrymans var. lacrymans S7.3]
MQRKGWVCHREKLVGCLSTGTQMGVIVLTHSWRIKSLTWRVLTSRLFTFSSSGGI